ncbi:MAG: hypothetical protein CMJ19_12980 [Phycisphaeraceae bacterium]|nr:hypothetical protein [Phycisphaeraceae bacterium]
MPILYFPIYLLVGLLIYLGPATVLLYFGLWRKMRLSHPRCAKCRYDLRTCWDQATCPECGSDIQKSDGVMFAERGLQKPLLVIALIWLTAPVLVGIVTLAVSQTTGIQALPRTSTPRLIAALNGGNMDEPWHWQELERRMLNGDLSAEQINACLVKLTEHLKTKQPANRGPLHWANKFIADILNSGKVTDENMVDFFETYYGYPIRFTSFRISQRYKRNEVMKVSLVFYHSWELRNNAPEPQCFLTDVVLEGDTPTPIAFESLEFRAIQQQRDDHAVPISLDFGLSDLYLLRVLPEAEHVLVFSFAIRYDKPVTANLKQNVSQRPVCITRKDVRVKVLINKVGVGKVTVLNDAEKPETVSTNMPRAMPQTP